jgi:KaiC/GvpD/RAD55 family RecA-like ATPase
MTANDAGTVLPTGGLDPGTGLLVSSPPTLGGRALCAGLLARALDDGAACLVVSTDRSARRVAAAVDDRAATDDATARLGVVDCTGGEAADGPTVVSVASPADLTGVAMAVSELVETLGARADDLWIALDSLSTLLVYNEFESTYRFVHTLVGRVQRVGARALLSLRADTDERAAEAVRGLVDGVVELRERDGTTEVRVRGVGDGAGWRAFDPGPSPAWGDDAGSTAGDASADPPPSLHDLVERMASEALTLTVLNPAEDGAVADLRSYFDRLSVETRTVDLPTETPAELAVLHRGGEPLATDHVPTLANWVRADDPASDGAVARAADLTRPDVVERANRDEYTVANAGKLRMVRVSRLIELRALDAGEGALHSGFQRLDRIDDDVSTRRLYERLAAAGVDVHVYGAPGDVPNADAYTLHAGPSDELADSWFVAYDGPPSASGALVSEETAPGRYSGFWTYRTDVTRATVDYLDAAY